MELPAQLDAILNASDLVAVLVRDVQVTIIDISSAGCLLESPNRLEEGTTGLLRVAFEGTEYLDDIRVMRSRECAGGSGRYQAGAEFLWTTSPHDRSLRRVVAKLRGGVLQARWSEPRM
jgi:hypothetical protein